MSKISWKATDRERVLASQIASKAQVLAKAQGYLISMMELEMDLLAAHANGCPLDLEALAQADDLNLEHDVFGIRRHIDRTTGALRDCFVPRYATRA